MNLEILAEHFGLQSSFLLSLFVCAPFCISYFFKIKRVEQDAQNIGRINYQKNHQSRI